MNTEPMKRIQQWIITRCDEEFEDIDILNFLGYIEIGSIMLQKGLISKNEFKNQFYGIIEWILNNHILKEHIRAYNKYYEDLLFIIYIFDRDVYMNLCKND